MDSSKFSALFLIVILCISTFAPSLGCGSCGKPKPKHRKPKPIVKPPVIVPPVTVPPVTVPPVTVPPVVKPTLPPLPIPPVVKPTLPPLPIPPVVNPTLPPLPVPPIVKPTLPPLPVPPVVKPTLPPLPVPPIVKPNLPPVTLPPVTLPPVVTNPPATSGKPCPPPPRKATCPIDTLKLGACVDLLGGLVHIGLGDPAVNKCCPLLHGLVEVEAAACLCTTLKLKALNLKVFVPIALQLLVSCGKTPPPGYTCSL